MVSDTTLPIALPSATVRRLGLEPLVRLALRPLVRVLPRRAALRFFGREARRIVALLEDLPARRGMVRLRVDGIAGLPGRSWSAYMVADHLQRAIDGTARTVASLTAGLEPAPVRPDEWKPRVGAGVEAARRFVAAVMDYEAAAARLPRPAGRARLSHPAFPGLGELDSHAWLWLAAFLLGRNRAQLERIVERLGERPL